MGEFLTVDELSDLIRKPVGTLRNWRWRSYGPPSFKAGGTVLYDRADVEAWVEAQKRAGASRRAAATRQPAG